MLKGTSSVNLVLPQIFCATFPLFQVSVIVFLPSLSLHLLDPIILPCVLWTAQFKTAESTMGLKSGAWSLKRSSESLRTQWSSTKILPAGILQHRCIYYEIVFFLLVACCCCCLFVWGFCLFVSGSKKNQLDQINKVLIQHGRSKYLSAL